MTERYEHIATVMDRVRATYQPLYTTSKQKEIVDALIDVAEAAQNFTTAEGDTWAFPRWDKAAAEAVAREKLVKALATLNDSLLAKRSNDGD